MSIIESKDRIFYYEKQIKDLDDYHKEKTEEHITLKNRNLKLIEKQKHFHDLFIKCGCEFCVPVNKDNN